MHLPARFHVGIHRLVWIVCAWTFLVIFVGSIVKSKEAGLTIPEPFFYQWMPAWLMTENLNAEYGHRIVAGALGILVLVLTVSLLVIESRKYVRHLAILVLAAVLAQAVLGGLTVHYFAHATTSIPHAALGHTFLCLMVCLVVVTSAQWITSETVGLAEVGQAEVGQAYKMVGQTFLSAPAAGGRDAHPPVNSSLRPSALALVAAVFFQLLLGAALRHDNQGAALRNGHEAVFVWHLIAHIFGAIAVLYFLARVLMQIFREYRGRTELMRPARALMILLTLQMAFGIGAAILKVLTIDDANWPPSMRVFVATTHVVMGALILAFAVVIALWSYRVKAVESQWQGPGTEPLRAST